MRTLFRIFVFVFLFIAKTSLSWAQQADDKVLQLQKQREQQMQIQKQQSRPRQSINEARDLSTNIFSFISQLSNKIDSFFDVQKLKHLNRNLRYFKTDLRDYLEVRKKIMDKLEMANYDVEKVDIRDEGKDLQRRLKALLDRLNVLRVDVDEQLSSDAEKMIENVYYADEQQQQHYVNPLQDLLSGGNVDKKKLKENGKKIYAELSKSIDLITAIQSKIKAKL